MFSNFVSSAINNLRIGKKSLNSIRYFLDSKPSPSEGLEEEYLEYQNLAFEFGKKELDEKSQEWDRTKFFDLEALKKFGELGFGGIFVDPDYGGSGMTRLGASVVYEALSYSDVPLTAFVTIHNMATWIVNEYGTKEQKEKYLPETSSLNKIWSYCLTEPGSGSDASSLRTKAVKDGDHYIVNGSKCFISGAGTSDYYLVMVRTNVNDLSPKGISSLIIHKDTPGIEFGKNEPKMGWACQPTRVISFENVKVPVENLVGKEGQGFEIALGGLETGRINIASCSLGGAQRAIDDAINHVSEREQFRKKISAFQNTQFKIADMVTDMQASRLIVRNAARAIDNSSSEASMQSAIAKRYATDVCHNIVDQALQLHGGYGYLQEYKVEQIYRDLRVHRILEGTNEIMKLIISRNIFKR